MSIKTAVITISSRVPDPVRESYYHLREFQESARRQGIAPHFLNEGKYCGLMSKPKQLKQYLDREGTQFDFVISVDAWDILLLTGVDELLYNYNGMGAPIVFSAERSCFPRHDLVEQFPDASTPYKFLNSGFFMGPTEAIQKMLATMEFNYGFPDDVRNPDGTWYGHNDQEDYSLHFLANRDRVKLDTTCILCQSLHDAGANEFAFLPDTRRVVSLLTKNQPCIVHGNGSGKDWLKRIIGWLKL